MDNTEEIARLTEQLKVMREAAEYWKNRYEDFYKKVDINVNIIDKKLDSIKEDYDLMLNTLKNIVSYSPDRLPEMFSTSRQLAFNCLVQLSINQKRRENE